MAFVESGVQYLDQTLPAAPTNPKYPYLDQLAQQPIGPLGRAVFYEDPKHPSHHSKCSPLYRYPNSTELRSIAEHEQPGYLKNKRWIRTQLGPEKRSSRKIF